MPEGHFSILTELAIGLIGPLEIAGYTLPETLWPDISEGRLWAEFLRDQGHDVGAVPYYWHVFEDGRPAVRAKAYPNELLPLFRGHFTTVWLRQRARTYFFQRDPDALPFLDKALPATRDPGMLPFFTEGIAYCGPIQPPLAKRRGWFRRSSR